MSDYTPAQADAPAGQQYQPMPPVPDHETTADAQRYYGYAVKDPVALSRTAKQLLAAGVIWSFGFAIITTVVLQLWASSGGHGLKLTAIPAALVLPLIFAGGPAALGFWRLSGTAGIWTSVLALILAGMLAFLCAATLLAVFTPFFLFGIVEAVSPGLLIAGIIKTCLLYTSDAADE